ncbi:MAG: GTP-binding protein [Oscillochloris sp.]|nr:GTP-binding protein [Oscillochloris sp.]
MSPPLTIVTGFLGSGKTTLLRSVLASGAGGRRLGLIVNEIGAVGFDGPALEQAGQLPLVELTAGCICCVAGSDFLLAVEQLIDYADPDVIVIETTGLAEPGGMIRQARAAELDLDAVIALAGATDLEAALAASAVAEWQLRAADIVALSKIDLSADKGRAALARIHAINPRAAIIPADQLAHTPDLIFGPRFGVDPPVDPLHREHDHFASMVWELDVPLRREALVRALDSLPAAVYRAKGRVACSDAPWPDDLQFVAGRHQFRAERPRGARRRSIRWC